LFECECRREQLPGGLVGHLRWHLKSIYKMAQSDGIVAFNPAAALFDHDRVRPQLAELDREDSSRTPRTSRICSTVITCLRFAGLQAGMR